VWPSVQGGREALPGSGFSGATGHYADSGHIDPGELVAGRIVAKTNPVFGSLKTIQQALARRPVNGLGSVAAASDDNEPALRVATVYQDPLTRYWAAELWDRVGQLIDKGTISRRSWKMSELTETKAFARSVRAAAEADVLVVSVRDEAELPLVMHVWIDAWLPRRAGLAGALVALIGVSAQPDARSGRAYLYLEAVARRAGLDYLPRERKLPKVPPAVSRLPGINPTATLAPPWAEETPHQKAAA
jgi:hypothetical protein